jgi:hypothetical protein
MRQYSLLLTLVVVVMPAFPVNAHAGDKTHAGQAYAFFGAHATSGEFGDLLSAGVGGEGFLYRGLALGGDLAYAFPRTAASEGIGLLTVNPSYHFVNADRSNRFVPFVTGGYALAFRSGTINLFNIGGGLTYWFSGRFGARFEVRNYRTAAEDATTQFRFAVAFR